MINIFHDPWTKCRNRCGTLKFWGLYESKPRFQIFSSWTKPFLRNWDGEIEFDRKRHPIYLKKCWKIKCCTRLSKYMELTWNPTKVFYLKLSIPSNFLLHSYPSCPRQPFPFDSEAEDRLLQCFVFVFKMQMHR
jgi:hypothetical protein